MDHPYYLALRSNYLAFDIISDLACDGLSVDGNAFPPGTVLSVPSFTIHRDLNVWGPDVEEDRKELMAKTFDPFSVGPRACVGRNLATLELQIIIASILRRFHFVLEKLEDGVPQRARTSCVNRCTAMLAFAAAMSCEIAKNEDANELGRSTNNSYMILYVL
ncbi:cytochrome P450, partial [Mycena pura]